ncbi:hypothetical protein C8J55DRAFT_565600 [Lentinula edodes]|uniref:Uncharacterized protein n=1 Tax=Lentinula lateritia TaxID=40482 RepID=A0A9W9DF60_9AGAR|nr:hypothetical protein C8J55DRAFT_565600 [Lentinula edodes]
MATTPDTPLSLTDTRAVALAVYEHQLQVASLVELTSQEEPSLEEHLDALIEQKRRERACSSESIAVQTSNSVSILVVDENRGIFCGNRAPRNSTIAELTGFIEELIKSQNDMQDQFVASEWQRKCTENDVEIHYEAALATLKQNQQLWEVAIDAWRDMLAMQEKLARVEQQLDDIRKSISVSIHDPK